MYLCDTDWMIDLLADRPGARLLLLPLAKVGLSLSLISLGELYDGVLHGRDPIAAERQLDRILAFIPIIGIDRETIRLFGAHRGLLRTTGNRLPDNDLLIAATALRHDLTLVTRNRRHFGRIPDLRLHDADGSSQGAAG